MNKTVTILKYHFFLFCSLIVISCDGKLKHDDNNKIEKTNFFTIHVGGNKIKVELAVLPKERQRGLMFREKMDEGTGMLFIFEEATGQKFWMKNTRIPLDIAYFSANGKLLEIHAAKPFDLAGVPSRSQNIQFVLELNLHDFRKQRIKIGDRLNLDEIRNALIEKGLKPNRYNIAF
ncbi:MAG: DUF192 domain-containing protein [Opitutales bacterium]|nr:DUF192 domain-containing protein [Opitutales bacterium]